MEKIKIDKSTFYRLLDILNSKDQENAGVAFEIIENASLETNIVQILLLYYYSRQDAGTWRSEAKTKWTMLNRLTHNQIDIIQFNEIFRIVKLLYADNLTLEDVELLFECYAKELSKTANNIFKDIEGVQIKLITHGSESRTASED